VGAAAVHVDVEAAWGVVDHVGLGTHGIEHRTRDGGRRAVRAVEADLHALHAEAARRDEVRYVAIASLHVVHGAANGVTRGQGDVELAVDV
jgi:hypothetical protein